MPCTFPHPFFPSKQVVGDEINDLSSTDFFKGKKVVLIGLPAAFSPTCSEKHVPGYLAHIDDFRKKGVDKVAVLAVNDFFTMKAWAKTQGVGTNLIFLADGNGEMTKALGVELDLSKALLGVRCKRFSMVVEDGLVKATAIEPDGTGYTVSSAENTLKQV
jgi:peroxiredoxin